MPILLPPTSSGMFEAFRRCHRIAVTGPQRSGTTIASQMLAADLGFLYVDEGEYGTNDVKRWLSALRQSPVVIQCPSMLPYLVEHPISDVTAVLMRRPLDEIHRSETRLGWQRDGVGPRARTACDAAASAYAFWDASPPPGSVEIEYASLQTHPLWVNPEARTNWHAKQTS